MARRTKGEGSIKQKADGRWEATFRVDGKPKYITGTDKDDVISRWNKAKVARDEGTYTEPSKMTLNQWIKRWLLIYKKNAIEPKSFEDYNNMWRLYIHDSIGEIKLQKLRGDDIQELVNKMHAEEYSVATIKQMYAVLRGSIYKAWQLDKIKTLPTKSVELPKAPQKSVVIFTTEEEKIFEEHAHEYELGNICLLMLYNGFRPGEALGLERKSIDYKKHVIKVRGNVQVIQNYDDDLKKVGRALHEKDYTKTPAGMRNVPMMPETEALLKQMDAESKHIRFICVDAKGQPVTVDKLDKAMVKMTKALKISEISPHKLRHTFATRQIENGMSQSALAKILGHTKTSMTDKYVHLSDNSLRAEMNKTALNKSAQ